MRVSFKFDKETSSKIAEKLAQEKEKEPKFEEEKISDSDEALDHAKTYWMLGWTWEEIESILEDMEFDAKTVGKAIEQSKVYAEEQLKDGPFSAVKIGQLIKLTNNQVGKVTEKRLECVAVTLADGTEIIADSRNIDFSTIDELKRAATLREVASKLMLQADELTDPGEMGLQKPIQEEFKIDFPAKAPPHVKELAPEKFIDYPEARSAVQDIGRQLVTLEKQKSEAEKYLEEAKALYKEAQATVKKFEKEQQEIGKNLALILGSEEQALDNLELTLFQRFDSLYLFFRRYIEKKEIPPSVLDEYEVLQELLEKKFPNIYSHLMAEISKWRESAFQIKEILKTKIDIVTPTQKELASKQAQSMWGKFKNWISNLWASIFESTEKVNDEIIPEIEELNMAMEDFISKVQSSESQQAIGSAIEKFNSK
jgi:hypothetical protein